MNDSLSIDKATTALVVIDLQKGIASRDTAPHAAADVISRSAQIAEKFRKNGMPVFLVRVTPSPDRKDALTPETDTPPFQTGDMPADWAELVPELNQQPSDFVLTKHQWGAFYGTDLDLQFRRRGIKTMVITGIATNIGVESTSRFAYEYGYNQIFVEDAMSGLSGEDHQFAIEKIFPRMGKVRSTEVVLNALI